MNPLPLEVLDDDAIATIFDAIANDVVNDLHGELQRHSELVGVLGASMTQLHLLAALGRYLEHQLPQAVVFARHQAWTFEQIGIPLEITGPAVLDRYRHALEQADTERSCDAPPSTAPAT